MKFTPISGRRFRTRTASGRSSGSPQMSGPVMRMAPKPRRLMTMSPPMVKRPERLASSLVMVVAPFSQDSERISARRALHRDPVFGGEVPDHAFRAEAAETRVLLAAERHVGEVDRWQVVDVRHAGLHPHREALATVEVLRQHRAGEAIFGVIRDSQRIRFVARANYRRDRTKDLVAAEAVLVCDVAEHMRRKHKPLRGATDPHDRTVGMGIGDHPIEPVQLALADDRADRRRGIVRVAVAERFYPR